jgi:mono/diheme cytochrome c family protein
VLGQANEYRIWSRRHHDQQRRYGSMFYLTTGFPRSARHRRSDRVHLIYMIRTDDAAGFTPAQATAAIVVSYYWHFVDIVWIALFFMIYILRSCRDASRFASVARLQDEVPCQGEVMSWKLGRRRRDDTAGDPVPAFRRPPGRLRRRLGATVRLLAALTIVGGLYTAAAPGITRADDTPPLSTAAQQGKELYETTCITCHGQNGQGVPGRGPSLIGAGSAAVEFQVGTGRMPWPRRRRRPREAPHYNWDQAARSAPTSRSSAAARRCPRAS